MNKIQTPILDRDKTQAAGQTSTQAADGDKMPSPPGAGPKEACKKRQTRGLWLPGCGNPGMEGRVVHRSWEGAGRVQGGEAVAVVGTRGCDWHPSS